MSREVGYEIVVPRAAPRPDHTAGRQHRYGSVQGEAPSRLDPHAVYIPDDNPMAPEKIAPEEAILG